jgi:DNA-binding NtrC family response regulator
MAEICVLTYGQLSDIVRSVVAQKGNDDILLLESTPKSVGENIKIALEQGCSVFVAGSANAAEFNRISRETLIEISVRTVDYALALKKALSIGSNPAFVIYIHGNKLFLDSLEELFNMKIPVIFYENSNDLESSIRNCDYDVIIGASQAVMIAEKNGKKKVLIYPGEFSVQNALNSASKMVDALKRRYKQFEFFRTVTEKSPIGILFVDEEGIIQIFNHAAEKITGVHADMVRGFSAKKKFPNSGVPWQLPEDKYYDNGIWHLNVPVEGSCYKLEYRGKNLGTILYLHRTLSLDENINEPASPDPCNQFKNDATFSCWNFSSYRMNQLVIDSKKIGWTAEVILITGEIGTGKIMLAECLHNYYCGENAPFKILDCAVIPEKQALQYIIGREGNDEKIISRGIFEMAAGGTVAIKNIWQCPKHVQQLLSNVIRKKRLIRLNGYSEINISSRIITIVPKRFYRDLLNMIEHELYYTITTFVLEMPPFRERAEDIPQMFEELLQRFKMLPLSRKSTKTLIPVLQEYSWPGNFYELSNVSKRFALTCDASEKDSPHMQKLMLISCIGEDLLFEDIAAKYGGMDNIKANPDLYSEFIEKLKNIMSFNNDEIASKMGISRSTLWRTNRRCIQNMPS